MKSFAKELAGFIGRRAATAATAALVAAGVSQGSAEIVGAGIGTGILIAVEYFLSKRKQKGA